MPARNKQNKYIAVNRKARHDYFVDETYEAGIALYGTEVKSVRLGQVNLKDSYVRIKNGEAFVVGMHVSPYEMGNIFNRDPFRQRKLLLHKTEIVRLRRATEAEGYSIIPLSLYLKDGLVKMEIAVAKGKKLYDKRDSAARRDAQREMERKMREKY